MVRVEELEESIVKMRESLLEFRKIVDNMLDDLTKSRSKRQQNEEYEEMLYKMLRERGKLTRGDVRGLFLGEKYQRVSYFIQKLKRKPGVKKIYNTYIYKPSIVDQDKSE